MIIGIGIFVCTYAYMYIWVVTGELNAKRVREKYLEATLRQDVAYFDNVGAGEVATRIQTDTRKTPSPLLVSDVLIRERLDLVQQGTSEKVALTISYLSSFATGFILAYAREWRLALAMSSLLPCMAISGSVMNTFISKYKQYGFIPQCGHLRLLTTDL